MKEGDDTTRRRSAPPTIAVMKRRSFLLAFLLTLGALSCGSDSRTVVPWDFFTTAVSSLMGTSLMQCTMVYPADTATGVPLDASIVIAFTMPVNNATVAANVTVTGSISGAHAFAASTSGNIVTINPTVDFTALEGVTVALTNSILSTTGETLDASYTFTFTAGTSSSASFAPRALAGTNSPTGTVSIGTTTAYITFSKPIVNATTTTCTINNGATVSAVTQVGATNTYALTLTGLAYNVAYTISLSCAGAQYINDGTYALVDDDGTPNNLWQWSFTTETDPAPAANVIDSVWSQTVSSTSSHIYFMTREYIDVTAASPKLRVRYGTASGVYTLDAGPENNWDAGNPLKYLHRITLTGLALGTTYYVQAYIDVDASGSYTVGDITAAEINFRTHRVLTVATGTQTNFVTLQQSTGGGFVFWTSDQALNSDIYGQFFSNGGIPQWTTANTTICTAANNQTQLRVFDDGSGGALVLFHGAASNTIRAKRVTSARAFTFGGGFASSGVDTGITFSAGTVFSAAVLPGGTQFAITYIDGTTTEVKGRVYSLTTGALATYAGPTADPVPANTGDNGAAFTGTYTGSGNGTFTVTVTYGDVWNIVTPPEIQWTWTPEGGAPGAPTGPIQVPSSPATIPLADGISIDITGGTGLTAGDNWTIDVGDTMNLDATNTFTRTEMLPGTGATSDFFMVASSATQIKAYGIDVTYGAAAPFASSWAAEDRICDNNNPANFGWANPRVFKLVPSLLTNGFYLLTDDGGTNTGIIRITDTDGGMDWANSFSGYQPDMVLDNILGGTDERVIIVNLNNDGTYDEVQGVDYYSDGSTSFGPAILSDSAGAYQCFLPRVALATTSTNASSFHVSWFDGRVGAGDYALIDGLYTSAGALTWRSFVYDTAAPAFELQNLYYVDGLPSATMGVIPLWREDTASIDIWYELVTEAGSY